MAVLPKGSATACTAAEAQVQTVFQGTSLRGMLLQENTYRLVADGPDRPHRRHSQLRTGREPPPAAVGLRALALPPGSHKEEIAEFAGTAPIDHKLAPSPSSELRPKVPAARSPGGETPSQETARLSTIPAGRGLV